MLAKLPVYSKLPNFQFICAYFPSLLKNLMKCSQVLLFPRSLKFLLWSHAGCYCLQYSFYAELKVLSFISRLSSFLIFILILIHLIFKESNTYFMYNISRSQNSLGRHISWTCRYSLHFSYVIVQQFKQLRGPSLNSSTVLLRVHFENTTPYAQNSFPSYLFFYSNFLQLCNLPKYNLFSYY